MKFPRIASFLSLAVFSLKIGAAEAPVLDVIVQTDGSTDALAAKVESVGGTVRVRYRNVPAVAARIPASELQALARLGGVTKVEKDRAFQLDALQPDGGGRARSYSAAPQGRHGTQPLTVANLQSLPAGLANFHYTGATEVWEQTGFGEGSIVAVVDTGVARNIAVGHAVIGAPGFPNGFSSFPDGLEATDPANNWHGTFVAGTIAAAVALTFEDPNDPLYRAIAAHWPIYQPAVPGEPMIVPFLGQAPAAKIYPVKVLDQNGSGSDSTILEGLDHVLTLKKSGALDIDIVNISLGRPGLWDGRTAYERFIGEFAKANILPVIAAGNSGPIPNSIGAPASSVAALSVAALDYAPSSRVFYEWLGESFGFGGGMGLIMRPTDEVRVATFSSRGPLSDGRSGPEIAALGEWNIGFGTFNEIIFAGGTSFAAPTVAGVGALLNADWESNHPETDPLLLETALLAGADPNLVGEPWSSVNAQGHGALNAVRALGALSQKNLAVKSLPKGALTANILGNPVKNKIQTWTSPAVELAPSQPLDLVLEVNPFTSKVTIEVFDLETPDNFPWSLAPNALAVHVQSAKRSAAEHPVFFYWDPNWLGNSFTIEINDGLWTVNGEPAASQPMEPGLMKITLLGDSVNESPVKLKARVIRDNHRAPLANRIANGVIKPDDFLEFEVQIPAGITTATFDLNWHRDWSAFPTSDLDLYLFDADFNLLTVEAATLNAPERAILHNPAPGTYLLMVHGFEVNKSDQYELFLRLD